MAERDLSLTGVQENSKEHPDIHPLHFSLADIRKHFDESIALTKQQFEIADTLIAEEQIEKAKTIWRSQVVFFEGVLDFYLHEICKYALYKIYVGDWNQTEKYKAITIPIRVVQDAINSRDGAEWFFDFVNLKYSNSVFLSPEDIKDVLNMSGVEYVKVMHKVFPTVTENEAKKQGDKILREQYSRRNQIAHQMDRSHASAEQADITKEYVEQYAENIIKIADAVQCLILEKDKEPSC
ncbi:MAG: hypothetical protein LUE27_03485 [Clostridia bacterium]|nr:hypothetical protein [Clostridia bacterium]